MLYGKGKLLNINNETKQARQHSLRKDCKSLHKQRQPESFVCVTLNKSQKEKGQLCKAASVVPFIFSSQLYLLLMLHKLKCQESLLKAQCEY